jgi:hypothetical protein
LAQRIQLTERIHGSQIGAHRLTRGDALGGVANLRFQPVILEERNREEDGEQQAERCGHGKQDSPRAAGFGAGAAGAHSAAVGQQDAGEELAEEHPLRHLARTGDHLLRAACMG